MMAPRPTHTASQPVADRVPRERRGVVERSTFQNPENGFTVARLAPERAVADAIGGTTTPSTAGSSA